MYSFVTSFVRMQTPTIGHERLVKFMKSIAPEADRRIYLSSSHGDTKNPIDFQTRFEWAKKAFEDVDLTVSEIPQHDIFSMLRFVSQLGYSTVHLVVGSDRLKDGLANRLQFHNATDFKIPFLRIHNAGERDSSANGVEGMSASKMRMAAKINDYDFFERGLPTNLRSMSSDIYAKVREACLSKDLAAS